jgi:hypothetical protein
MAGDMTVQFALPAAISFGVADFAGGLATRRTSATLAVIAAAQLAGAAALLPALVLLPGGPSVLAAGVGALAGLAGPPDWCCISGGLPMGRWAWSPRYPRLPARGCRWRLA